MADLSINVAVPRSTAWGKIIWSLVAIVGFFGAAFILYFRFTYTCPRFDLNGFALMPMSGIMSGSDPHFFFRVMHNLTQIGRASCRERVYSSV